MSNLCYLFNHYSATTKTGVGILSLITLIHCLSELHLVSNGLTALDQEQPFLNIFCSQ
jgi:hypothetical protein